MKKIFSISLLSMLLVTLLLPLKAYPIDNDIPQNNSALNLKMDERRLWKILKLMIKVKIT